MVGITLRAVLDTSVLAAALRSRRGASFALLSAVGRSRLIPLATPALFLEYEAVLKRPEQRAASGFSVAEIDTLLRAMAGVIEAVEVHIAWRPQLRDPDDELVFEAAINGRAEALVTHNIKDFVEAAPRFGLRVARPAEIVQELEL